MRKLLFGFMAMVLVASMICPCCIEDDCATEKTLANNQQEEHSKSCSPFFSCNTCCGFADFQKQITITAPIAQYSKQLVPGELIIRHYFCGKLFQPPRT